MKIKLFYSRLSISDMIPRFLKISLILVPICSFTSLQSQNIVVDAHTYTPQQLVENILIDSGCIENISVTNNVGGNFSDGDRSYGYFHSNGADFPFEKGLVLSTGKLSHLPGPNTTLSDDDAPGWIGDVDLEAAIGISNTTNATIIEFDFVPKANTIRFRYIFASEEYQEGDPNTCRYSDAFAFLIKPMGGSYSNIALVPGTQTPVLVTTVHSGIPGSCPPINETYFEGWNGPAAPINLNGQTTVLVAESAVVANESYHIKLVIADHSNYRYDSAVFLEGGSFNISADLGPDRSFPTNNPLCENEIHTLDATPEEIIPLGYKWFRNGIVLVGETSSQLSVTDAGIYKVEVDYGDNCIATDEVLIQYDGPVLVRNTELYQCEPTATGRAVFNLFDAEMAIIDGNQNLRVHSFHHSFDEAHADIAPIPNPRNYSNSIPEERVFARVVSEYGCVGVAEITLKTTTNTVSDFSLVACSNPGTPGYANFDLTEITAQLRELFGNDPRVAYYSSYSDAISQTRPLSIPFTNTRAGVQTIYARIGGDLGCLGMAKINLRIINTPEFGGQDTYIYCLNDFPAKIVLSSGLLGTISDAQFLWSTGETTPEIRVNEAGTYTVQVTRSGAIGGEPYYCSNSRSITVIASEPPGVNYVLEGSFGNQTLIVLVIGAGDYRYSLENGTFQADPIFPNLRPGKYSLSVKDLNGCGTTTIRVYVLGFPNFFTPNNDGIHDYWQVKGLDRDNLQLEQIQIFDRFGKNIHILDLYGNGWDGTYNGRPLPSSDYWFRAIFKDSPIYKGHFTLKR